MDNQRYLEDEIDLRDYLRVIIRRKVTILGIFLICVITGTIVSFLMPKVYEVSAIIRIGSIPEPLVSDSEKKPKLLISKPEAIQILQGQEMLSSIIQEFNLDMDIFQLKEMTEIEEIEDSNLLKLKIEHADPDLAVKICSTLANSFVLEGKERYNKRYNLLNEEIQKLEERREVIETGMERLNKKISTGRINPDYPLIQNTISNYEALYLNLKGKIYSLKKVLIDSQEFEVIEPPLRPKYPIRPKKGLNIVISASLGLIMGLLIAFFKEFWQKGMVNGVRP